MVTLAGLTPHASHILVAMSDSLLSLNLSWKLSLATVSLVTHLGPSLGRFR